MNKIINGTLSVPDFSSSGVGEWTFVQASFNYFFDFTGNGQPAADITTGFVIYVPAVHPTEFFPLTGVVHRYKLTSISNVIDNKFDGTILWDEGGDEIDRPQGGGCICVISEAGANKRLGFPVSSQTYPDLGAGQDMYALTVDARSIIDPNLGTGGGGSAPWVIKTVANTNDVLTSGAVIGVNSTGGAFTLKFPASPTAGDTIRVADVGGACFANNVTIDRNGSSNNIAGVAENFLIDVNYIDITFIYTTAFGWSPVQ